MGVHRRLKSSGTAVSEIVADNGFQTHQLKNASNKKEESVLKE
jgi:hypothetical protein